ncbi:MAG: hypothetical protein LUE99_02310 [Bacteroides sp.]|nr:hypothetical protein [Bacteroides sp.]
MTTMELEAQKAMLAREILNIDDLELVKKLKNYVSRTIAKAKAKEEEVEEEDLTPYTMEEINSWIDEAEAEEEAGIPGTPHEQVFANMEKKYPWLCQYQ